MGGLRRQIWKVRGNYINNILNKGYSFDMQERGRQNRDRSKPLFRFRFETETEKLLNNVLILGC